MSQNDFLSKLMSLLRQKAEARTACDFEREREIGDEIRELKEKQGAAVALDPA